MYYAGVNGFSYSSYDDDNDDDGSGYSAKCNSGYGVGCTYTDGFAYLTYSSDSCNPANATGVSDTMQDLNSAMNNVQCTQVYDANQYSGYVYGTPLELLAYSRACMYQNFYSPEGECPDPFGVLALYQENFNAGIKRQTAADPYLQYKRLMEGRVMVVIGTLFFALAGALLLWDTKNPTASPWEKSMYKKIGKTMGGRTERQDPDPSATYDGESSYMEPTVEMTETRKEATPKATPASSEPQPDFITRTLTHLGVERSLSPQASPQKTMPAPASSPEPKETTPVSSPEPKTDGLMRAEPRPKKRGSGLFAKLRGKIRK
jgi:hypothetical protein